MPDLDVLIVGLGTTGGLRAAEDELAASLERAGSSVVLARTARPRDVRTFMLTDLVQARMARRAALDALRDVNPRAILYAETTAALLWPRPGAIRFDATASGNRPGRHGLWQRRVERDRLRESPLLIPWSDAALEEAGRPGAPAVVVPVPVEASGPPAAERDIAALAYAANPSKKGLDRVLGAWARARRDAETLVVAGLEDLPDTPGVSAAGALEPAQYRALLRRARVFVAAARREDYGIAQLEALADGCALVTTASPGPYAALPLARELDGRLVGDDLATAIRTALDDPLPGYAERAAALLAPYRRGAVDEVVARELLPRLLP